MRKLFSVSPLVAVLIMLAAATGVQAFIVRQYVWPTTSTTYVLDASFTGRGLDWVARANEAAQHWTTNTYFDFFSNAGSSNRVQTGSLACDTLAITNSAEDALGIYRTSFAITVNVSPICNFTWYAGTDTPPFGQYDLRTVLRHEFGHAAGLRHVTGSEAQLMHPVIRPQTIKQIAVDDQNGMNFLYNPDTSITLVTADNYYTGVTYDNPSYQVGYKGRGWSGGSPFPRTLNQTHSWANQKGASTWFAFNGNRITWVFAKTFNRGWHDIYIDGVYQESINTYDGSDTLWQVHRTWDMGTSGDHIIEIRKPTDEAAYTDLDAYIVNIPQAAGDHDNSSNSVKYIGAWTHGTGWVGPTSGTVSWSNTADDATVFTFVGDGITYRYTKASNRGIAKVTIDGNFRQTIDLYSGTTAWQQTTRWDLSFGTHTIHIAVTGDKNGASSGTYIDVDQFEVD